MAKRNFMRTLGVLATGLSLAGGLLGLTESGGLPLYEVLAGLLLGGGILVAPALGDFVRYFVVFYALGYLGLAGLLMGVSLLPGAVQALVPPPLTAFTAAAFGILALLLARLPLFRRIFSIADPYFGTPEKGVLDLPLVGAVTLPERWIAYALLGTIILINLGQVAVMVQLSYWSRDWLDSIQNKNAAEFWRLLFGVWVPWVALLIASNVVEFILVAVFKIRWRQWTTRHVIARWLDEGTHYRLQFSQAREGGAVDNPDQRIQEDINKYINTTYSLTISMIQQISTLISFAVILWGLSAALLIPGTDTKLPGLLFWISLAYAALGTLVTHIIGRKLIPLNFRQEQYEANFRFSLARLREYAEPIALLKGERAEKHALERRFQAVLTNYFKIVDVQKWLTAFVQLYGSANSVIPYVIAAPFYFAGQITLGVLNQTAGAFSRVDAALSFFIDRYSSLAEYKAVVERLYGFEQVIGAAIARREATQIMAKTASGVDLDMPALSLALPGGKQIVRAEGQHLRAGERTLLVGPSGSGKSTLFRAIAGIWPFGAGEIALPAGKRVMLLPQRPYIPIGALKSALCYPSTPGAFGDAALRAALEAVQLPALAARLDEEANWSQVLSGGEQQRLAIARALLEKPDWLFLDEATSALDEPLEQAIYAAIRRELPAATVVSIGHRSSLIGVHDRRIEMRQGDGGVFLLADAPLA